MEESQEKCYQLMSTVNNLFLLSFLDDEEYAHGHHFVVVSTKLSSTQIVEVPETLCARRNI